MKASIVRSPLARKGLLASFLFVACMLPINAQLTTTGTIRGVVTDQAGALVPSADVSIENQTTNAIFKLKTAKDGSYVLSGLEPDRYKVRVEASGFKASVVADVQVHPALVADVPTTLTIGETSAVVTVSANDSQVQLSTPEISGELSGKQVEDLPMNGRNYQTLAAQMPGAVNTQAGNSMGQGGYKTSNVMSANGMGLSGTFYTVDGIWNENTGNFTQPSVTPSPDTIAEVRILQNNYSAQYNLIGANVVIVQTKSGGAAFHGSAYDFFRNDALNTRNYFGTSVSSLRQNIYGYTWGGPLFIPKIYPRGKSKTFFFIGEQWSPIHAGSVITGTTATAAMRMGDFSALLPGTVVKNPVTNVAFPGNVIPMNLINTSALALINSNAPLPNKAGTTLNYVNTDPEFDSQRNDFAKVDHDLSARYRMTGEYIGEHANTLYSNDASDSSPFNTVKQNASWADYLTQVQLAATISPTMLDQFSIAMNHRVISLTQTGITNLSQLPSYTQTVPYTTGLGTQRLPQISFSQGYATFGAATGLPLVRNSNLDLTFSNDWSWSSGAHYLQVGASYYMGSKRQSNITNSNGAWTFSGAYSGNAIADYLLGDAATFSQANTYTRPYIKYPALSFYVEDTWKINRRLTFSGGVRYLWMPAPHVAAGTETVFDPSSYQLSEAPVVNINGTITTTTTPNYNALNGLVYNGENGVPLNFANLDKNYLAPTIGFALDVFGNGKTSLRGGYGVADDRTPTAYDCSLSCASNPPATTSLSFTKATFPTLSSATVSASSAQAISSEVPNLRAAMVQSFSLSLEQQLPYGLLFSAAYAGNIVQHLPIGLNINQPLPVGGFDFNPNLNGSTYSSSYYAPYPGYAAITTKSSEGASNWNALELSLRHAAGHYLFFGAGYTYSHDLANMDGTAIFSGNNTVQNAYDIRRNYGNSLLNIPSVFAGSVILSLPGLPHGSAFTRAALGGWKFSDITALQSGASLDPAISTSTKGLASRPSLSGQPIKGPRTVAQWFNTTAFVAPASGYFGNAEPGSIAGPHTYVFDMALYKSLPVYRESALEFRGEVFNVFNHTNFSGVSTSLGSASYGQVTTAKDPRIVEFALKFRF